MTKRSDNGFTYSGKKSKHNTCRHVLALGCIVALISALIVCLGRISWMIDASSDEFLQDIAAQNATTLDERVNQRMTNLGALADMLGETQARSPQRYVQILSRHTSDYRRMGIITDGGMLYISGEPSRLLENDDVYSSAFHSASIGNYGIITGMHTEADGNQALICAVSLPRSSSISGVLFGVVSKDVFAYSLLGDATYNTYMCIADQDGNIINMTQPMEQALNDAHSGDYSKFSNAIFTSYTNNYSPVSWGGYRVATAQLGFNGWVLARLTPEAEIFDLSRRAVTLSASLALLCVALIAGISSFTLLRRVRSSENRAREAEIDALTGVNNSVGFARAAGDIIKNSGAQKYALVYMHTDIQEVYGARYGYESGRRALENVARLISAECESGETCARIEGGQFALMLRFTDTADMLLRIKALNSHLLTLSSVRIRTHYGVYVPTAPGELLAQMVERASAALRRVMLKGDLVGLYDDELHCKQVEEEDLTNRAQTAVKNGEFEVCYRPLKDADTLEIVGAEAIALWRQPGGRVLTPDDYVPLLTRYAMMGPLNMFVLERACRDIKAELDAGRLPGRILLSFARENLLDGMFVPTAQQIMQKYGVSGERLEAVLSEAIFSNDIALVKNVISQMHADNLRVCVGDFGQGATALGIFDEMPVDAIRFGGEFVSRACDSEKGRQLLSGLITLAKTTGIDAYAYSTSDEQLTLLRQSGCIRIQGYETCHPEYCELKDIKSARANKPYDPFDDWA